MTPLVDVQIACRVAGLPGTADIGRWAAAALEETPGQAELTVRLVTATESANLNHTYRHRPGPTNVLSFPFAPCEGLAVPLLGDVVICATVVAREAGHQGKSLCAHFAHLVVHGTLHLLGYDHQTHRQAEVMESRERGILAGLGFADPYALRDGHG